MGLSHSPRIVTDGLVFCVDAGDKMSYPGAGTTWTDLSKNRSNGTLTNGPTFNSANGGSIVFDGSNDRIETNYTEALGTSDFSYECWVRYTVTNQTGNLISKRSNVAYEQASLFISGQQDGGSTGAKVCFYHRSGNVRSFASSLNYNDDKWHHIVLSSVHDGKTSLYIDNEEIASRDNALSTITETPPILIGCAADGSSPYSGRIAHFNGKIAIAKVYTRALSAAEITQNYNATRGRFQ